MIDRGTIVRGFVVLVLLSFVLAGAYAVLGNTEGTSGNFLEDDSAKRWRYGAI
jgi:hypothetical protein